MRQARANVAVVIDDVVAEITLHRNVAPARNAAEHMGEKVVVPGAAVAAHTTGRDGLARTWLKRALADNPRFSPLYGPRAERLLETLR